MLNNDYLVAKIGVDTAENEPYVKSLAVVAILLDPPWRASADGLQMASTFPRASEWHAASPLQ